jgi:hypothetical protein
MVVSLYIFSPKYENNLKLFNADNTTVDADTTLFTADQIYLSGQEGFFNVAQRIELYKDEKISLTSSIQDIADVSKAKTDFTQSFTIPASRVNNIIFKHWYESAIDGGFDQRIKYNGFVEIDTIPFREGGFALNSVNLKDGKPDSYNITFYGNAKSIKDVLREDKLSNLDFSDLNHSFTPAEVISRIESSTQSVAYPLFAYDRLYSYNDSSATDVTTTTGAIVWNSLFPAVSLATILQKIEDKYGLTFMGAFVNYVQFSKLWMLFKNTESLIVPTEPQKINFTSKDGELSNAELNLTTDEIGFQYSGFSDNKLRFLRIGITPTSSVIPYDVLIYKNGVLFNSFNNLLGNTINTFFNGQFNTQTINDKYTLYVQSELPINYEAILVYRRVFENTFIATNSSQTTVANINIGSYAPELKLIDLMNGLIKMFNLVVIPINDTTFELIPLELYYNNGRFNDISGKVGTDSIEIKKTSMYKNINFKYQKSEAILNNKFNELFTPSRGYNYGDLTYEQIDSLESNTLTVDLPFENAIYERKSDSNFQTITFKNKDLNNYMPKPLLMYDNGVQDLGGNIVIETISGTTTINDYRRYSNDIDNGGLITLNWGEEVSQWDLNVASNGLYQRHYQNYLGNIFNLKGRLLIVKCKFTSVELSRLQLNDRIVIRDNRYTINKLTTDLTTGETTLELLTDYRVGDVQIGNRYASEELYIVSAEAQELDIMVLMAGFDLVRIDNTTDTWLSYTLGEFDSNFNLTISIDGNNTAEQRIGNIELTYITITEDGKFDEIQISIPIIQEANVGFDSDLITFDNNEITFDNDGNN